ncbi:fumarylacetoacetate hydrolase family protein [Methylomonas sp. BW4-1]|uniref:fumarylacetoacetate hydrolase family protein n=1 Tax=Methylomonas sp. BW4-1 TaxID=3376685 RepID=UPI004041A3C3
MKLLSYKYNGQVHIGALVGAQIVPAGADLPGNMLDFLAAGESAKLALQKQIAADGERIALSDVQLLAPIPRPGKLLGVGLNYADHIGETGLEKPEYPTFFTKQSTCVIADGDAIHLPPVSDKVDYEGELAFVIGKRCKHVSVEQAHEVIAGYTICNDVTVRDWQQRTPTWTLGKSFDTHGPLGPWLVTADEIVDPHNLSLKTWVGDELRQNGNTGDMIFNCYELIAYLTQVMTLEPGDVISTGTPAGVGVKMKPRGYLKPGQTVRIEIEGIGTLSNPVIAEPEHFLVGASG